MSTHFNKEICSCVTLISASFGLKWFFKNEAKTSRPFGGDLIEAFAVNQFLIHPQILNLVSSVQSLSRVRLFAIPWISVCQASLSITNSRSLLKLMSIKSVMPSSHLILCHPLLLLPPIPPSIRVFSNESARHIKWQSTRVHLQHQSFQWTPRTDLL